MKNLLLTSAFCLSMCCGIFAASSGKLIYIDENKNLEFLGKTLSCLDSGVTKFSRIIKLGDIAYFFSEKEIFNHKITTERFFYSYDSKTNKCYILCKQNIFHDSLNEIDSIIQIKGDFTVETSVIDTKYYSPEIEVSKLLYSHGSMFDFYSNYLAFSDYYSIAISDHENHARVFQLKNMPIRGGAFSLTPTFSTNGNFLVYILQKAKNSENSFEFNKTSTYIICGIDLKRRRFVDFQYCSNNVEYAVLNECTKELLIVSKADGDLVKKISVLDLSIMTITFETLGYSAGWL